MNYKIPLYKTDKRLAVFGFHICYKLTNFDGSLVGVAKSKGLLF